MLPHMQTEIEEMTLTAQETLDDLFTETRIPFELLARALESIGLQEYIIRFHDSRLRSVDVSMAEGQSFKTVFRGAILDRVSRLGGPLRYRVG